LAPYLSALVWDQKKGCTVCNPFKAFNSNDLNY